MLDIIWNVMYIVFLY